LSVLGLDSFTRGLGTVAKTEEAAVAASLALYLGHWCGMQVTEVVMLPGA